MHTHSKVLDSLMVAEVSDFRNYLCCSSLYFFYFINVLPLNVRTRIALHVLDVGALGICIMGGSVLCFCTFSTVLCFCTRSAIDLLSATVDWTCYSCFARCFVRCASKIIYLH